MKLPVKYVAKIGLIVVCVAGVTLLGGCAIYPIGYAPTVYSAPVYAQPAYAAPVYVQPGVSLGIGISSGYHRQYRGGRW